MVNQYCIFYQCVQKEKHQPYYCKKFLSFEKAEQDYHKSCNDDRVVSAILVPVCKYVPSVFHPFIVRYHLSRLVVRTLFENKCRLPYMD